MAVTSARDALLASTGKPRGRGRPREFDVNLHLSLPRDLHNRLAAFAEVHEITNANAIRRLVELALTELEKASG